MDSKERDRDRERFPLLNIRSLVPRDPHLVLQLVERGLGLLPRHLAVQLRSLLDHRAALYLPAVALHNQLDLRDLSRKAKNNDLQYVSAKKGKSGTSLVLLFTSPRSLSTTSWICEIHRKREFDPVTGQERNETPRGLEFTATWICTCQKTAENVSVSAPKRLQKPAHGPCSNGRHGRLVSIVTKRGSGQAGTHTYTHTRTHTHTHTSARTHAHTRTPASRKAQAPCAT